MNTLTKILVLTIASLFIWEGAGIVGTFAGYDIPRPSSYILGEPGALDLRYVSLTRNGDKVVTHAGDYPYTLQASYPFPYNPAHEITDSYILKVNVDGLSLTGDVMVFIGVETGLNWTSKIDGYRYTPANPSLWGEDMLTRSGYQLLGDTTFGFAIPPLFQFVADGEYTFYSISVFVGVYDNEMVLLDTLYISLDYAEA